MQDVDAVHDTHLLEERKTAVPRNADATNRPNTAAVLAMLAALEAEFRSVLNPPAPRSEDH
jgi:hypothetical protein